MSQEDTCPPYLPLLLWWLKHKPPPPPPLVEEWVIIEDIVVSLQEYAMTYLMKNQELGQRMRETSKQELSESVKNLGKGI